MVSITETQKIGVGLTGFGLFFLLFGVLLYFDSVLLAFGNRDTSTSHGVDQAVLGTLDFNGCAKFQDIGRNWNTLSYKSMQSIRCLVLFLTGLTFIIGLRRSAGFFFQRQKLRGSTFFLGGVALVLFRWPIIGMAVESYGFVLLFRSFFPVACGFILSLVNIPYLNVLYNSFLGSSPSIV
uniref:Uncharacterized protein n=1 Tax=Oncorhynchus tshawytscha TaxID=74940 RepID=A0A8C8HMU8_ONCTS